MQFSCILLLSLGKLQEQESNMKQKVTREHLYIATFSEDALAVIREQKLNVELDHLCISENLDQKAETLAQIRADWIQSEARLAIAHGPYTELNAACADPKAEALSMERFQEAYELCAEIGVNRLIFHTGYVPVMHYKVWHKEKSVTFWNCFLKDKPADFQLYLENVYEEEPYFLKELMEEIADPRIGLCLDVGHMHAFSDESCSETQWIQILGPWIGHVHLHNNRGVRDEHAPVDQGTMDMDKILKLLAVYARPDVTYTIESHTCKESVRWLLEA